VHHGVEALGEDLEGFWEPEEAEGGDAPRPLGASGNGYTLRFSLGWVF